MKTKYSLIGGWCLWLVLLANLANAQSPSPVVGLDHNLELSASIPENLQVMESEVVWHIRSLTGGEIKTFQGRHLPLSLPEGKYAVDLQVGAYTEQVTVAVQSGKLASSHFTANIGRLKVSSSALLDWEIYEKSGAATSSPQQIMKQQASRQISGLVAAGDYELVATLNNARQRQSIHIARGGVVDTTLNIPTGKVNLVATLGNGPAMRPMSWKIYRLDDKRQEVSASRSHSATLNVIPGRYEAVARLDGRERHREFTVMDGTSSSVVMSMD
jgi:hypothetical protein